MPSHMLTVAGGMHDLIIVLTVAGGMQNWNYLSLCWLLQGACMTGTACHCVDWCRGHAGLELPVIVLTVAGGMQDWNYLSLCWLLQGACRTGTTCHCVDCCRGHRDWNYLSLCWLLQGACRTGTTYTPTVSQSPLNWAVWSIRGRKTSNNTGHRMRQHCLSLLHRYVRSQPAVTSANLSQLYANLVNIVLCKVIFKDVCLIL